MYGHYGVKHFRAHLLGHKFVLQTDHEPQQTLLKQFHHTHPTGFRGGHGLLHFMSNLFSARRQLNHANIDSMSQLPLPYTLDETLSKRNCFWWSRGYRMLQSQPSR